jgi:thiol-disulfide isomerase/thioredoxin
MSSYHKKVLGGLILLLMLGSIATYFIVTRSTNQINEQTVALFSNPEGEAPYTDLLGNPVSLEQYLGKTLVVATWASWSPFSTADLLMMTELSAEFANREVVFMAINRKESKEQAARFLETLPNIAGVVMVLDPRDAFYLTVGGYAMPEIVIFNSKGEVLEHYRGVADKGSIKNILVQALAESEG